MADKKTIDIYILNVEDEHISYVETYEDGTEKIRRSKTKSFGAYYETNDIVSVVTVGMVDLGFISVDSRCIFIVTHKDLSKEILVIKEGWSSCNELLLISQKSARKPFPPKYSDNVKYGFADDDVYIFLGVSFDDSEKYYFYLADDDCYEIGDKVVVPAGPDNIETVGEVITVQKHRRKTAPYPIEKTKYVIEWAGDDYEI